MANDRAAVNDSEADAMGKAGKPGPNDTDVQVPPLLADLYTGLDDRQKALLVNGLWQIDQAFTVKSDQARAAATSKPNTEDGAREHALVIGRSHGLMDAGDLLRGIARALGSGL
jgi:hypothetical protein